MLGASLFFAFAVAPERYSVDVVIRRANRLQQRQEWDDTSKYTGTYSHGQKHGKGRCARSLCLKRRAVGC